MGWEVAVLDGLPADDFSEQGDPAAVLPPAPPADEITPAQLAELLEQPGTVLLDFTTSANYVARHIPGAYWVIRSRLPLALENLPPAERYVLTCGSSLLARYAVPDVTALTGKSVRLLAGGTQAWIAEDRPLVSGEDRLISPRIDRYRRPYEGTDNPREAMQAYLDWEFGLVAQLERDATHGFNVL
ncbi:molybdopterin biosynthesis protein MoeB [Serratia rubidaea]|uniref:Molybdopterin biosynthesis protein MoeB n=1 Tax=Serratia rubidaea TaxID=61652 RepID=A0A448SCS9_SERRU|nr:molybdopterin biosynthesis protein MoeB [Serratia rubidaea]